MGIRISESNEPLGLEDTGVDKFNNFVEVAIEKYIKSKAQPTEIEQKAFKVLENEKYPKYLVGADNSDNSLLILCVNPKRVTDEGLAEVKVYKLGMDNTSSNGAFLTVNNITSYKDLREFKMEQKWANSGKLSAEVRSALDICDRLIAHHSPPPSPRSQQELIDASEVPPGPGRRT